ncbi:RNA polymerase sigma-70 factor [Dyadobacter sp. CY323]|uniref:RNA polymerase sigma-70 factor n=1 Tax=Dyadobacter sp. CY323 TaxID=2907302 RepID=UPI001F37F7D8|nr:RNA polymerase sigma-70 factor [Dyadobacter sp. CY323]MCE6988076.1 RNA polymerase sigma-70 factor [Dyadobacter sp. CY323]
MRTPDQLSDFSKDNAGSGLSFETIFGKSYAGLVFFSFNITGDRQESEDIVQDAFVQYWNRRHEVTPDLAVIKGYLYTTVRNSSLNLLKHQKIVQRFRDQQPSEPVEERSIENEIIRSEVLSQIHHAIESLPAGCRRISEMSYLDGKKNQEIADELGVSVNTVKTQKQRALYLLRQKLSMETFSLLLLIILK